MSPSVAPNTAGSAAQDDASSPLEMLRFAMLQLSSSGADEQVVDSISSMLQVSHPMIMTIYRLDYCCLRLLQAAITANAAVNK